MRIAVVGGTGPAGRGLAVRLASVGYDVVLGSRSKERAIERRDDLLKEWPDRDFVLDAADNEGAASDADVVVIATPWDAAATTAADLGKALSGRVVISMGNALVRSAGEFTALVTSRGSVAATVQAAVPDALVAAAFQHVPAKELGDLDHEVRCDVVVCTDHPAAYETTAGIVRSVPGLRPLDGGGLAAAAAVEAMTAVLLQLNKRYKTRVAVTLTGIDEA